MSKNVLDNMINKHKTFSQKRNTECVMIKQREDLDIPIEYLTPVEIKVEVIKTTKKKRRIAIKLSDNDTDSVTSFDSGITGMTGFT